MQTLELHKEKIFAALLAAGVPSANIKLRDEFYAVTTEYWIRGPFAAEYFRVLQQQGFTGQEEKTDCDDYALEALNWASRFHRQTPGAPAAGLAFGFVLNTALEHSFNCSLHRDTGSAGNLIVRWHEPQPDARGFTMRPLELDRATIGKTYLALL